MANQLKKFQSVVEKVRTKYEPYHFGEKHIDFKQNYIHENQSETDESAGSVRNIHLQSTLLYIKIL